MNFNTIYKLCKNYLILQLTFLSISCPHMARRFMVKLIWRSDMQVYAGTIILPSPTHITAWNHHSWSSGKCDIQLQGDTGIKYTVNDRGKYRDEGGNFNINWSEIALVLVRWLTYHTVRLTQVAYVALYMATIICKWLFFTLSFSNQYGWLN